MIDRKRYQQIVNFVIDNFEGGYYHPDMLKDGRVKDQRYAASGETMFGIDRKAGGTLNTSPEGIHFWSIIDNSGARKNWHWNYKGGSLNQTLKNAAADVMYNQYEKLADRYLSPESKKIVESDNRLLFHFIYATWNGSGWFQRYANEFNAAVSKGMRNKEQLVNLAVASRAESSNSLIRQVGQKIANVINELKEAAEEKAQQTVEYTKKNWIPIALVVVGAVGLIYLSFNYDKLNKKIQIA